MGVGLAHRVPGFLTYTSGMAPLASMVGLVLALAPPMRGGVEIVSAGDRFDVTAFQAPLSEVLEGLARKTRMKVVYEGPAPRASVSVELRGRTSAEAVLGVLDGLGVDYALALDATGTQVETLVIVGTGARAASAVAVRPPPRGGRITDGSYADLESAMAEAEEPASPAEDGVPAVSTAAPELPKVNGRAAPVLGPLNPTGAFPNGSPFVPGAPGPLTPSPSPNPPSTN